jgi:hypothetical protein
VLLLAKANATTLRGLLGFLCALSLAATAHAEGAASGHPSPIAFEIENQTPCFFFGGYQLSLGMRHERFRFRASIQDSGVADFEPTGIDSRNGAFRRSFDSGSFSLSVDYFLTKCLFATACLGSNRWLVQNKDTQASGDLRTLDAGLGLGFQYVFFQGLFIQLAAQVNFRERRSLDIQGVTYTVPGIDYSPGLRLGYQF